MKANKNNLYLMWSLAIILCMLMSLFALIFTSCAKSDGTRLKDNGKKLPVSDEQTPEPDQTDDPGQSGEPEPTAEPTPETPTTRLAETADAGSEYLDKLTFLGDSTTYGLKFYEMLSGGSETKQVWTPASGTLALFNQSIATIVYPETGEEIPITDAVARAKPEYMVITLGVNGVAMMDEEYFTSEYTALVKRIQENSPDTKIILNSIYPVSSKYEHLDQINNDKIQAANVWVEKVAGDTGVRFLNTYEAIVGSDGWLPLEYENGGDGMHLNPAGFNVILEYIKTHEYK